MNEQSRGGAPLLHLSPLAVAFIVIGVGFLAAMGVFFVLPNVLVDNSKFEPMSATPTPTATATPSPSATPRASGSANPVANEEKRLKARHDVRTVGMQLIGALVLIVGGAFTWRTVWVTREGQLTDRFTKAVEHLGHKETPVRVGAIYALGRVARDSRTDQAAVMALLADHLRASTPWPPAEPDDQDEKATLAPIPLPHPEVRAVARVLRERTIAEARDAALDLSGIDFRSAPLAGTALSNASFAHSNLKGADFTNAHLEGADLSTAIEASVDDAMTDDKTQPPQPPQERFPN
jgi:Pentapeptide repeats (8 copies)